MATKNDQIAALALEVLEDAEMSRGSVESLILKASRLARLVGDEEVATWLYHEVHGYNASSEVCLKYLGLTSRWIDVEANKAYFAGLTVHEALLDSCKEEMEVVKRFVPSGQYSASQFHNQQKQASEITAKMLYARRIVSAVRAQIQDFATHVYHERLFSHQAETIFQLYQEQVDALLAATAGSAFEKLPHAFERLGAGDREAISHALTTCRRVIDSFADSVFPARGEPAKIGEQEIEVGDRQVRNRLRAYIYGRIGQCSRYERLNKTLGLLYDRVSTGVHADVETGEARAIVLQTYLILGELLSLPAPSTIR
jgi:hypothetical protein